MREVEVQTNGMIPKDAFYSASTVAPVSDLIAAMSDNDAEVTLTCHEHCGVGTYVFKEEDGTVIPITKFIDVDKFIDLIEKSIPDVSKNTRLSKTKTVARAIKELPKTVNTDESPSYINITKLLKNIFIKQDYSSLGDFHINALLISCMHFMDPFNFDQDRVSKCVIHYAIPDGRIIPFCSMNNIYRESVEEEFHIPLNSPRAKEIISNMNKKE